MSNQVEDSVFVCGIEEGFREACAEEAFYGEHEGKKYCALHFPAVGKKEAFEAALKRKISAKDFNFRGVWFPNGVDFSEVDFTAAADFGDAKFLGEAIFRKSKFIGTANFSDARFEGKAMFDFAQFGAEAVFDNAKFTGKATFISAKFKDEVRFGAEIREGAYLDDDVLVRSVSSRRETVSFRSLLLRNSTFDNPERVFFHSLKLRPASFIDVDSRKFQFVNVEWEGKAERRDRLIKKEIASIREMDPYVEAPADSLSIACRNLAVNAEDTYQYDLASRFRYWSMEARRRGHRISFSLRMFYFLYKWLSGYGENVMRAFVGLVAIWIVCAVFYTQMGFVKPESKATPALIDTVGAPLRYFDAPVYSFSAMTLQRPEPSPLTRAARIVVNLEAALGPVQLALFALALRRQYMDSK